MASWTDHTKVGRGALRGVSSVRGLLPDLFVIGGALMLLTGIREIYAPAAWIFVGLLAIAAGLIMFWSRQ